MTPTRDTQSASSGEIEIVGSRVFAAPRELVFEAFRNPNHLVHWWGPKGFSNTFHEFDLRPGGAWRLTMHGPDGVDYEMEKYFREVIPPERIVLDHRQPMHNFRITMTFAETAGNTSLTWLMRFESRAENEKLRSFIPQPSRKTSTGLRRISGGFRPIAATPNTVRMKTIITLIAAALMAGCASHRGHLPESASQSHPSNRRYHMSPNKLTVEKYMDGFNKSDHAQVLSCLTNDVEVIPGAFHIKGKAAFDKEIENDAFVGRPTVKVTRMTEEHGVVIAEGSVRSARKAGGFLNAVFCDVFVMQDAKISI